MINILYYSGVEVTNDIKHKDYPTKAFWKTWLWNFLALSEVFATCKGRIIDIKRYLASTKESFEKIILTHIIPKMIESEAQFGYKKELMHFLCYKAILPDNVLQFDMRICNQTSIISRPSPTTHFLQPCD